MATQAFMLRAAAFCFHGQRGLSVELGSCNLSGGHRKRKHHLKLASLLPFPTTLLTSMRP